MTSRATGPSRSGSPDQASARPSLSSQTKTYESTPGRLISSTMSTPSPASSVGLAGGLSGTGPPPGSPLGSGAGALGPAGLDGRGEAPAPPRTPLAMTATAATTAIAAEARTPIDRDERCWFMAKVSVSRSPGLRGGSTGDRPRRARIVTRFGRRNRTSGPASSPPRRHPSTGRGRSAVEREPAPVVAQPLIVQDQLADLRGELLALPAALGSPRLVALAPESCGAGGLHRVGGRAELMRRDV